MEKMKVRALHVQQMRPAHLLHVLALLALALLLTACGGGGGAAAPASPPSGNSQPASVAPSSPAVARESRTGAGLRWGMYLTFTMSLD